MLLERAGEIVTRDELRRKLWPGQTIVDFDDGLHTAVRKVRDLLGDSADSPRYIETVPRRGYRFAAQVRAAAAEGGRARPAAPWLAISCWWPRRRSRSRRGCTARAAPCRFAPSRCCRWRTSPATPRRDYFAAGLTDALTTELARAGGEVAAGDLAHPRRRSTAGKPLEQIARELDVDAVIQGSVVRSGDRARRITAQLVHARADKHLWAASYERDLHDLLALHREIAATVARQVRITLSPRAQARLASTAAFDPQAYDLYQRGRYIAFSNNRQEIAAAIALLEQAVEREPNLAAAHALLARTYSTGPSWWTRGRQISRPGRWTR
jgi:TolB-like protein